MINKKVVDEKRKFKEKYGFEHKHLMIYIPMLFLVLVGITYLASNLSKYMFAAIVLFQFILIGSTYPILRYLTKRGLLK